MRAFTVYQRLWQLAAAYKLPLQADIVVRDPHGAERPLESLRQRKDGTIVLTTRSKW